MNLPESQRTKQGSVKKTLQETGKYSVISQMLRRTLGDHFEEEYGITGDTTVAEYVSFISSQDINDTEKEVLLEAI